MERDTSKIRQQGFVPLATLLEITRDALRAMTREEKLIAGRMLTREVAKWCSYSQEEALGILESAKFQFLQMAEDNFEQLEAVRERKEVKRIT